MNIKQAKAKNDKNQGRFYADVQGAHDVVRIRLTQDQVSQLLSAANDTGLEVLEIGSGTSAKLLICNT